MAGFYVFFLLTFVGIVTIWSMAVIQVGRSMSLKGRSEVLGVLLALLLGPFGWLIVSAIPPNREGMRRRKERQRILEIQERRWRLGLPPDRADNPFGRYE